MAKVWEPFPKQKEFLALPFNIREALYGGAVNSGKTELLIMAPIAYGFHKHPAYRGILFRKTFKQLEESIIPRAMPIYTKALGARWNGSNHTWTFPSGAKEHVSYLETEQDARDHDTNEYHFARFEELTQFIEFCYTFIMTTRVRTTIDELPMITRSASNPGNIGNNWVRDRFVKPYRDGGKVIKDGITGLYRYYCHTTIDDNPLTRDEYKAGLLGLPEAEKRAKLYGDWWSFAGTVFREFRTKHFEDEPENAIHVVTPFEIPSWWPVVLAIDWGYAAHTWAGWFALSPDGRVYLYKEYYVTKQSISRWAAEITALSQTELRNEQIRSVELDPSAWQRRGTEKDIWQQFYDGTDHLLRPHQADNARLHGKQIIHDMLRWQPRPLRFQVDVKNFDPELAQRIITDYGLRAYNNYLLQFQEDKPESVLPRLQFFNTCQYAIEAIQACNYNEVGKGNVEDVAEWAEDDPYDGIRYGCVAIDRYLYGVQREAQERRKIDEVIQKLTDTGDYTQFYRRLEYLEAEAAKSKQGVGKRLPGSVRRRRYYGAA